MQFRKQGALSIESESVPARSLHKADCMKLLLVLSFVTIASIASARESFLFDGSAEQTFGGFATTNDSRYSKDALASMHQGWRPLRSTLGGELPTPLKIFVKDDSIDSQLTRAYVETLSSEKSTLMNIYGLSNVEYNKLAAIAFGILGRETKFGTSLKYQWKERHQTEIWGFKLAKKKFGDSIAAIQSINLSRPLDPWRFFGVKTWSVAPNSRGLTQIKAVPESVVRYYCIDESKLNDPRMTAITTVGFLAESLRILKNRVRNRDLMYVTNENLFDYVLYVYFGSMRQLVNPLLDFSTGQLANEFATPDRNLYIQTVRRYMRALAFYEFPGVKLQRRTDYACRIPGDN